MTELTHKDDDTAPLGVSELNARARRLLETRFAGIRVEGEISELLQHRSGHWYFTLKDENSQLRAAMFRYQNRSVRFQPEDGQHVVLTGKLSLYEVRGSYQFIADKMEPAGAGQLQRKFEALKTSLAAEGLFDQERKQTVPNFPRAIAVITSPQGAALQDILSTLARRFPSQRLVLVPVAVQGEGSAESIVTAIEQINRLGKQPQSGFEPDVILLARGGGSIEDLWSFNEEIVARAIARSNLPIVSAVGHETDTTIADWVADLRAPTPTAGAELLSPDGALLASQLGQYQRRLQFLAQQQLRNAQLEVRALAARLQHPDIRLRQLSQRLDALDLRMTHALQTRLHHAQQEFTLLSSRLRAHSPIDLLDRQKQRLHERLQQLLFQAERHVDRNRARLLQAGAKLNVISPLATLDRGYSITRDAKGQVLHGVSGLKPGDSLETILAGGRLSSTIDSFD